MHFVCDSVAITRA